jgi:SHS2 domain-containing protein
MNSTPYAAFEHTADIGLHAYGETLPDLFIHAAQGMESLMVAPEQVRPVASREIVAEGHDDVSLLIAWLSQMIVLFDSEFLLFRDFAIDEMTPTRVMGRAFGEPYDAHRHDLSSAIKAVTWHEAAIERESDGYTATIIFDI